MPVEGFIDYVGSIPTVSIIGNLAKWYTRKIVTLLIKSSLSTIFTGANSKLGSLLVNRAFLFLKLTKLK